MALALEDEDDVVGVPGPEVAEGHTEPGELEDITLGLWMMGRIKSLSNSFYNH